MYNFTTFAMQLNELRSEHSEKVNISLHGLLVVIGGRFCSTLSSALPLHLVFVQQHHHLHNSLHQLPIQQYRGDHFLCCFSHMFNTHDLTLMVNSQWWSVPGYEKSCHEKSHVDEWSPISTTCHWLSSTEKFVILDRNRSLSIKTFYPPPKALSQPVTNCLDCNSYDRSPLIKTVWRSEPVRV